MNLGQNQRHLRPPWSTAIIFSALCTLGALWYQSVTYLHPDVSWLLHVARASADGAVLYKDLVEINPPLAIWLLYPVLGISDMMGIPLDVAVSLAVSVAAFGSIASVLWLLEPRERSLALPVLTLVCFVVPHRDFGQREHLLMLSLIPFLGLVVRRVRGGTVHTAVAVLIGVTAAIGFALKPQFGLVWVGLAAYLIHYLGFQRFLRLPETMTLVVAAPVYLLAVSLITPDYWAVVRAIGPLYLRYRPVPARTLLLQPAIMAALLSSGLWSMVRNRVQGRGLEDVLAIALLGAVGGVIVQGKGLYYHYLPAVGMTVLLLVTLMGRWKPLTVTGGLLLLIAIQVVSNWYSIEWKILNRGSSPVTQLKAQVTSVLEPGDHISILSWHLLDAWPLALSFGSAYTSPMPSMWWLRVLYPTQSGDFRQVVFHAPGAMSATERYLFEMTVHDLLSNRPGVIVMPFGSGLAPTQAIPEWEYDVAKYLSQDSRVKDLLGDYVFQSRVGRLAVWRRLDLPAPDRIPVPEPGMDGVAP